MSDPRFIPTPTPVERRQDRTRTAAAKRATITRRQARAAKRIIVGGAR